MNPKLSILIVTWNSWDDLNRCLESIRQVDLSSDEMEIVVIDNGSVDDTVACVQQRFPEVRLHVNETNLGLPPAVNQGLRLTRGEYILLLDVDTEVAAWTPIRLLEFMEQHTDIGMSAARIYTPEGSIEQSARNLPSFTSAIFGRQSILRRWFPNNPFSRRYMLPENLDKQEPFQIEQVSAACMFMRRSVVERAGPWDEGYRCYWIDSDWCARLKSMGEKIFCVPAAQVTHYENNRAGKKKSTWRIWHFHMGAYRLYRKYYTWGMLDPRALFALVALTCRAGMMLVINAFVRDASGNSKASQGNPA